MPLETTQTLYILISYTCEVEAMLVPLNIGPLNDVC